MENNKFETVISGNRKNKAAVIDKKLHNDSLHSKITNNTQQKVYNKAVDGKNKNKAKNIESRDEIFNTSFSSKTTNSQHKNEDQQDNVQSASVDGDSSKKSKTSSKSSSSDFKKQVSEKAATK